MLKTATVTFFAGDSIQMTLFAPRQSNPSSEAPNPLKRLKGCAQKYKDLEEGLEYLRSAKITVRHKLAKMQSEFPFFTPKLEALQKRYKTEVKYGDFAWLIQNQVFALLEEIEAFKDDMGRMKAYIASCETKISNYSQKVKQLFKRCKQEGFLLEEDIQALNPLLKLGDYQDSKKALKLIMEKLELLSAAQKETNNPTAANSEQPAASPEVAQEISSPAP